MTYYKIHYEVDTGSDYQRDTALVKAENKESALEKLRPYIWKCGYDCAISEVFSVEEFTDDIFSSRFWPGMYTKYYKEK